MVPLKEQNALVITEPSLLPSSGVRDKVLCSLDYPQQLSVANDSFELLMLLPTSKYQPRAHAAIACKIFYIKGVLDLVGLKLLVKELFIITVNYLGL